MWDIVPIYNLGLGLCPIYFILLSERQTDNEIEYNNVNKGKFNPVIEVTRELKDKYSKI